MTTTTTAKTEYRIEEVAHIVGISTGALRMWELRYGWPRPPRYPNGYRYYTPALIEQIDAVARLILDGAIISDIIKDGTPNLSRGTSAVLLAKKVEYLTTALAAAKECLRCPPQKWWTSEEQVKRDNALAMPGAEMETQRLERLRLDDAERQRLEQTIADLRAALSLSQAMASVPVTAVRPTTDAQVLRQQLDAMTKSYHHVSEVTVPHLLRQIQTLESRSAGGRRGRHDPR